MKKAPGDFKRSSGPFIYVWYTGIYLYENLIQSLIRVRYGKSDAKHILQKENIVMIDIYTERKDSKDWIFYNDLYFNLNTGNEDMSQKEIDLIQQVDEAKLTQDKHIETKYGLGTIRNLSSGCKTLLNIVKHPDKVVNVEECGPNVLRIIFTMDNIKIFMSRPTLFDIPDDAKIRFNDSDIVIGGRGYNAWLKGWEEIDFETVSNVAVGEIQQVIQQIILCLR